MIATIDTNILINAFSKHELDHLSVTMIFTSDKRLKIGCDNTGNIVQHEYEKNVGKLPLFRKWFVRLVENQSIHMCNGKLAKRHRDKLSKLGCHEPSDHVFVAVAFNSGKVLVTEDSDFGKGPKGHEEPHPQALKYLSEEMQIQVYDAPEFLQVKID